MKAVISTTFDDLYFFYTPIVLWSWKKIGCETILITPSYPPQEKGLYERSLLAFSTCAKQNCYPINLCFEAPDHKKATYAQCARLFGAAFPLRDDKEVLITGDIDMAVFNEAYFAQANNECINVFGADLVPPNQYPICYISMPATTWRTVMGIENGTTVQKYLDELVGVIECEHFRANQWALDQDTIYKRLTASGHQPIKHYRAKAPHQFATCRADRDGWPDSPPIGIIDAHLPRPGYTEENFAKILKLFQEIYPDEDFTWMVEYQKEYIKLL